MLPLINVNTIDGTVVPANIAQVTVFREGERAMRKLKPGDARPEGFMGVEGDEIETPTTLVQFSCGAVLRCWGTPPEVAGALLGALTPKQEAIITAPAGTRLRH